MTLKIQKWGNSLALRIPKSYVQQSGIVQGTTVEISIEEGNIVLRPSAYSLNELLTAINESNLHGEMDTGKPVGRELL